VTDETTRDELWLVDIRQAIAAIRDHLTHGDLDAPVVFDAVRMRLMISWRANRRSLGGRSAACGTS